MNYLALFVLAVLVPASLGGLIVGGKESTPNSRPYQVALLDYGGRQFCGGTLVHPRWVITAGHCSGGTVYVGLGFHSISGGGSGTQEIRGTWIRHSGYNGNTLDNDIALIRLNNNANINSKVQTISVTNSYPSSGTSLLVSGWGTTSAGGGQPSTLREVVVSATSYNSCNNDYGGELTNNMFCAKASGKDSCQGDSGGPIVSNFNSNSHNSNTRLEGVVSWGYGCADSRYPGVYTRVGNYCSWLSSTSGGQVSC